MKLALFSFRKREREAIGYVDEDGFIHDRKKLP
jgi:hypothetical protein